MSQKFVFLLMAGLLAGGWATSEAQEKSPAPAAASQAAQKMGAAAGPAVAPDEKFLRERFGAEFTPVPEFAPMVADVDGDGVDDLVVVARARNPMLDAGPLGYRVLDPYYTFFGFGDARVTSGFGAEDPTHKGTVLLVIHGAGEEAWRAAAPKAKFVLINLPFKAVWLRRVLVKRKVRMAIAIEEYGSQQETSAIYWDGKGYKYEPLGSAMQ
jgi:hypothetical protein